MTFLVLGLNHKTAPVALRERFAFSPGEREEALTLFPSVSGGPAECVLLSTCNRVELYTATPDPAPAAAQAKKFLLDFHDLSPEELDGNLYTHAGTEAASHLFRVVSGLDSMVVGENEILGQVKEAYEQAHRAKRTGKALNLLFQKSFKVAKRVRTQTFIGRGAVSVGSVVSELAERIFRNLSERTILVLGAGEMAELALTHLRARGARSVIVSNRSFDKACELAARFEGRAVRFDDALPEMVGADIVVTAAACPHVIIHAEPLRELMRKRHGRLLFLIDIAVPRNVDPSVQSLDNIFLYNIDDLQQIVETNLQERNRWIQQGNELIQEEVDKFMRLYESTLRANDPGIPTA